MDDLLWLMKQQSRVLQELRLNTQGVWQDEAARELSSRYLTPHEDEDQYMLAGFSQQYEAIEQSKTRIITAEEHAVQSGNYAEIVDEELKLTEQELQGSYGNYDTYVRYHAEARSKFPIIQDLLDQANSVCTD